MPNIRFTKTDCKVLKTVTQINNLGTQGARLLLASVVADAVLAMGNPIEFSVTVAASDYDDIANGAKNIAKIAACSAYEIIYGHVEVGPDSPTGAALDYFKTLMAAAEARCQA